MSADKDRARIALDELQTQLTHIHNSWFTISQLINLIEQLSHEDVATIAAIRTVGDGLLTHANIAEEELGELRDRLGRCGHV